MLRLLLVNAGARGAGSVSIADEESATRGAENALTLSLMFSGVRCLLQYALLPFCAADRGHRR